MNKSKAAVILAAGKGKRMLSDLPKVLHPIHGRPMIQILLDTLKPLGFAHTVIVIGHKGEQVQEALAGYDVEFAWQHEQLGTGHAVKMARPMLADFDGTVLIAAGDVPFLSRKSISGLFDVSARNHAAAACLSAVFEDPTGYGRIIREPDTDRLKAIVEHKDASEEIRRINEVNSGTFCFDAKLLFDSLEKISSNNSQGEYYLTDAIKILYDNGLTVVVTIAENPDEVRGVNSVDQLSELEQKFALPK